MRLILNLVLLPSVLCWPLQGGTSFILVHFSQFLKVSRPVSVAPRPAAASPGNLLQVGVLSLSPRRTQNRWGRGPTVHPQVTVKPASSSSTAWFLLVFLLRGIWFWLWISYFSMQKSRDVDKCKDDNRNQTFSMLTLWGKSFARCVRERERD